MVEWQEVLEVRGRPHFGSPMERLDELSQSCVYDEKMWRIISVEGKTRVETTER